jgi:hypothetical protein
MPADPREEGAAYLPAWRWATSHVTVYVKSFLVATVVIDAAIEFGGQVWLPPATASLRSRIRVGALVLFVGLVVGVVVACLWAVVRSSFDQRDALRNESRDLRDRLASAELPAIPANHPVQLCAAARLLAEYVGRYAKGPGGESAAEFMTGRADGLGAAIPSSGTAQALIEALAQHFPDLAETRRDWNAAKQATDEAFYPVVDVINDGVDGLQAHPALRREGLEKLKKVFQSAAGSAAIQAWYTPMDASVDCIFELSWGDSVLLRTNGYVRFSELATGVLAGDSRGTTEEQATAREGLLQLQALWQPTKASSEYKRLLQAESALGATRDTLVEGLHQIPTRAIQSRCLLCGG